MTIIEQGSGPAPQAAPDLIKETTTQTFVKDVIEAHGGTVWVESELGAGTKIHIRLPHAPGESPRS